MANEMQLNKDKFVREILNKDFKGDEKKCAIALEVDPGYFRQMMSTSTKKGGTKLLGSVYEYCENTGRNPKQFIFPE